MFFRFVLLLSVISVSAMAQERSRLALFLDFQHAPSERVSLEMQTEVERLFGPDAGPVTWRALRQNTGKESFHRLAVIHLSGTCKAGEVAVPARGRHGTQLGSTLVSSGTVLPVVNVECDKVRWFLREADERLYGRALGQVVAHELYHVLLGTVAHSQSGLSKAAHSSLDLGRVSYGFDSGVREKLLAALGR